MIDFDVESAVLSELIHSNPQQLESILATGLNEEHFLLPQNKMLFRVLSSDKFDILAIHEQLKVDGILDKIGGSARLADLVDSGWSPDAFGNDHAKILVDRLARNRIVKKLSDITAQVRSGQSVDGELVEIDKELHGIDEKKEKATWSDATGADFFDANKLMQVKDLPVPYVLDPIAIRGCLTQIHGPPKGGKSTWATYLSVAAAFGKLPDEDAIQVMEPLRVLYLSWEDQAPLIARRICSYSAGLGFGWVVPVGFTFSYGADLWLNLRDHADILERTIADEKFDLVVIDTFSYVHSVDEDKATEIKPVMAALRRIARKTNCAIVYIHHARKSKEGARSERARGSTAISAAADVIIDWGDRGDSDTTPVDVTSKWGRSGQWNINYITEPDQSVRWEIRERGKKSKRSEESRQAVLLTVIALFDAEKKPIPGSDIVASMKDQGLGKSKTYDYLKQLESEAKIRSIPNGKSTVYQPIV